MSALAIVEEGKLPLAQEIAVLPSEAWPGISEIAKQSSARRNFSLDRLRNDGRSIPQVEGRGHAHRP